MLLIVWPVLDGLAKSFSLPNFLRPAGEGLERTNPFSRETFPEDSQ